MISFLNSFSISDLPFSFDVLDKKKTLYFADLESLICGLYGYLEDLQKTLNRKRELLSLTRLDFLNNRQLIVENMQLDAHLRTTYYDLKNYDDLVVALEGVSFVFEKQYLPEFDEPPIPMKHVFNEYSPSFEYYCNLEEVRGESTYDNSYPKDHNGQLKLYAASLRFLESYCDHRYPIIFLGSAPGYNIEWLIAQYPSSTFIRVDDHFSHLGSSPTAVYSFSDFEKYMADDVKVNLIHDTFDSSAYGDEDLDYMNYVSYCLSGKVVAASFKKFISYSSVPNMRLYGSDLVLQHFSSFRSVEVREMIAFSLDKPILLVPMSSDLIGKIHYYNKNVRTQRLCPSSFTGCSCYDCCVFSYNIREFSRNKDSRWISLVFSAVNSMNSTEKYIPSNVIVDALKNPDVCYINRFGTSYIRCASGVVLSTLDPDSVSGNVKSVITTDLSRTDVDPSIVTYCDLFGELYHAVVPYYRKYVIRGALSYLVRKPGGSFLVLHASHASSVCPKCSRGNEYSVQFRYYAVTQADIFCSCCGTFSYQKHSSL